MRTMVQNLYSKFIISFHICRKYEWHGISSDQFLFSASFFGGAWILIDCWYIFNKGRLMGLSPKISRRYWMG
jgi:hypothetical protein